MSIALIKRCFKLDVKNTSISTECYAGLVNFLSMAYIIIAVSKVISPEMASSVALSCFVGTLSVVFLTNTPVGCAPGLGLTFYLYYYFLLPKRMSLTAAMGLQVVAGFLIILFTAIRLVSLTFLRI